MFAIPTGRAEISEGENALRLGNKELGLLIRICDEQRT